MNIRNQILVADDQIVNRVILEGMFKSSYDVLSASDGYEAIDIIKNNKDTISIILLDIVMPNLDGFGVLDFLKENKLDDLIPVILITSDSSDDTIIKGYKYKVADILTKPFNVNIVIRRVNNIIELYAHKRSLEETVSMQTQTLKEQFYELAIKNRQLEETQDSMTEALSNIVEFRNNESGGHIRRIKNYCMILGKVIMEEYSEYKLTPEKIIQISKAAAMHDVGKISISDTILLKPGKLTKAEYEVMKNHTVIGCELLKNFEFINDKAFYEYSYDICRHHHERYDGNGYPDCLSGDSISIAAQIVSLADVYDALVTKRCYKDAYTTDEAYTMILNKQCGTFGPKILDCFNKSKSDFENVV